MTNTLPPDHADRLARARLALDGLSVGDALGETCFHPDNFDALLDDPRATAREPWPWTDDTAMALGVYEVLHQHGHIDQDDLARVFAARFAAEPWRGYGPGARRLLDAVAGGADWRAAAVDLFGGGSFGNGSAMRIAPLAGYFAADGFEKVAEQAALSAAVTHAHPEGVAGGAAAAVAGAYAWQHRDRRADPAVKRGLFDAVLAHTPAGLVRTGIQRAAELSVELPDPYVKLLDHGMSVVPFDVTIAPVVKALGNGSMVSCQDTVPFCLWVAARRLDDYEKAIVETVRGGGDIDTTAAIVGGIVALAVGADGIPADWLAGREALPG